MTAVNIAMKTVQQTANVTPDVKMVSGTPRARTAAAATPVSIVTKGQGNNVCHVNQATSTCQQSVPKNALINAQRVRVNPRALRVKMDSLK